MIFTTQFLHLLCFRDQAQAAQTPLLLVLFFMFPVHAMLLPSHAELQGSTAQPIPACLEPLDPPTHSSPTFPAWCHLQSSQPPPAVFLLCWTSQRAPSVAAGTVPAPPVCSQCPSLGLLIPPPLWGEAPIPKFLFSGIS